MSKYNVKNETTKERNGERESHLKVLVFIMKMELKDNESRLAWLYLLALRRLTKLNKSSSGIIKFPLVFEKLCSSFQIRKKHAWKILDTLRDLGYIEIVPSQGIRIKNFKFLKIGESNDKR